MVVLEPAPLEYGLHRAQYDLVVHELEALGLRVRLVNRRTAYRVVGTRTFGTFFDLVIRIDHDALARVDVDELIERVQQQLSTDVLPPDPRMGKLLLDDGTEYPFPLDEADVP